MDAAKAAVQDFMQKSGHHDTTVHEKVAPAVVKETVERREHEELVTAIDKEVHQDHYHTSVQPIQDKEVLREQHHHNVIPVEHRSFEHDDAEKVKARLAQEQAQFRDETRRVEGEHTHSAAPIIAGEHIHHHVHETIQPVVNKQTIEPHVVHTTVPIHEVHHQAAQHHAVSALPPVTMEQFKKQGGALTGREERYDGFEGEPRHVGGLGESTTGTSGLGSSTGSSGLGSSTRGTTGASGLERGLERDATGTTGTGSSHKFGTMEPETKTKPSLMDKVNPKVDANGDGKAGFMK